MGGCGRDPTAVRRKPEEGNLRRQAAGQRIRTQNGQGVRSRRIRQANLALIRVGAPAVPGILELLASSDPRQRSLALSTLWGMGSKAEAAVPTLAATLVDPDPEMRNGAAMALANMGATAAPAVPALIAALGDADRRVRQTAVKALGNIGPAAKDAIPVISRAVKRGAWPEGEEAIRQIQGRPAPSLATPRTSPAGPWSRSAASPTKRGCSPRSPPGPMRLA